MLKTLPPYMENVVRIPILTNYVAIRMKCQQYKELADYFFLDCFLITRAERSYIGTEELLE